MKITRNDVMGLYRAIDVESKSQESLKFEFTYALNKNKHRLKPIAEETQDQISLFQKHGKDIIIKYSPDEKEAAGNKEYDAEVEQLNEKFRAYMREEIDIDPYKIKKEYFPKECKAFIVDALFPFIEE